jgi:hypothetical protein
MNELISFASVLTCALVGLILFVVQDVIRDEQDGQAQANSSLPWYVWFLGLLGLVAFGLAGGGVHRLVEEFGYATLLPSLTIPPVTLYAVWILGWSTGRDEGKAVERGHLKPGARLRSTRDS